MNSWKRQRNFLETDLLQIDRPDIVIPNIKLEAISDDEDVSRESYNKVSESVFFRELQKQNSSANSNNGILDQETSVFRTPSQSPVTSPSQTTNPIASPSPSLSPTTNMNQYKAKSAQSVRERGSTRNAWGNCSYSDLITKAIMSSPSKKMSLQEIYQWIGNNIPYFMDKKDGLTTAGWKNSVRHTLSIRKKFVRLPNYDYGNLNYKSLWTVDLAAESRGRPKVNYIYQDNRAFTVNTPLAAWKQQVESWSGGHPNSELSNRFCSYCGQIRFNSPNEFLAYQDDQNAMRHSFRGDNF